MGRPRGWSAQQPTCRHGHEYPQYLAYDGQGFAYCIKCRRIRDRNRWREAYGVGEPDPIAIDRAVAGDPPDQLTTRELHAAVLALTERNLAAWRIAEQVGCSKRTVHRIRGRYAAAA